MPLFWQSLSVVSSTPAAFRGKIRLLAMLTFMGIWTSSIPPSPRVLLEFLLSFLTKIMGNQHSEGFFWWDGNHAASPFLNGNNQLFWLVVSFPTHLKNIRSRQIGNLPPRIGVFKKLLKPPPSLGTPESNNHGARNKTKRNQHE